MWKNLVEKSEKVEKFVWKSGVNLGKSVKKWKNIETAKSGKHSGKIFKWKIWKTLAKKVKVEKCEKSGVKWGKFGQSLKRKHLGIF